MNGKTRMLATGLMIGAGLWFLGVALSHDGRLDDGTAATEPILHFGWAAAGTLLIVAGVLCCVHWPRRK